MIGASFDGPEEAFFSRQWHSAGQPPAARAPLLAPAAAARRVSRLPRAAPSRVGFAFDACGPSSCPLFGRHLGTASVASAFLYGPTQADLPHPSSMVPSSFLEPYLNREVEVTEHISTLVAFSIFRSGCHLAHTVCCRRASYTVRSSFEVTLAGVVREVRDES